MTASATSSLSIIIPFLNEEDAIGPLIARLGPVVEALAARWRVQLVLVDDGSTDTTYEKLSQGFVKPRFQDVAILRHIKNRGIGAAMRTGFDAASGDLICTLDSDCTYAPEDIPRLVDLLLRSRADIVTGSPYHPLGKVENVAGWRIALSRGASQIYGLILPTKLYCYTSFLRCYRREWARTDLFFADGFLAVCEILVNSLAMGATIIECPVSLSSRVHGVSKMKTLRTMRSHMRLMTKTAWFRLLGKLPVAAGAEVQPAPSTASYNAGQMSGTNKTT